MSTYRPMCVKYFRENIWQCRVHSKYAYVTINKKFFLSQSTYLVCVWRLAIQTWRSFSDFFRHRLPRILLSNSVFIRIRRAQDISLSNIYWINFSTSITVKQSTCQSVNNLSIYQLVWMNIHVISQRSHWSTHIYAVRTRPTPDDVVRQNVESNQLQHQRKWRCDNARFRPVCEQRRLNNVFNYSLSSDVVRRRTTSDDDGQRLTTSCGVWTGLNSFVAVCLHVRC